MRKIHERVRTSILNIVDFFYPLFKRIFTLHTFRYAACGGANTLLDIVLFSTSYHLILKGQDLALGAITLSPHTASLFMALCISLPTGFYLNRYVVFQESGLRRRSQLLRYATVTFICIGFNYVLLKLFVEYLGWYPTPSKIITTLIVTVFSYVSQTFFFFKTRVTVK